MAYYCFKFLIWITSGLVKTEKILKFIDDSISPYSRNSTLVTIGPEVLNLTYHFLISFKGNVSLIRKILYLLQNVPPK